MPSIVSLLRRALLVVSAVIGHAVPAGAQDAPSVERTGPRFLLASASSGKRVEIDVSAVPLFRRRVSLTIEDAKLSQALELIGQQTGVLFSYDPTLSVLKRPVTVRADGLTLAATLTEVLFDSGLDVLVSDQRHVALVPRPVPPQPGSITGRVTDAETGQGMGDVEVLIEGTSWRTLTGTDGHYRLAEVDTGSHIVTARRIGYAKQSRSVVVAEAQEITLDFALQVRPTRLEEVVTTGTVVPTEVKALPTPISVITADDIAQRRPHTLREVIRQAVPTAVTPNFPHTPAQTLVSVRGVSSLVPVPMKVFVDGVEAASYGLSPVDPASVERIEVVRGPQAATLYGADAVGGVIQIFTKRGQTDLMRPQILARAALGIAQTPYRGFGGVLRQEYEGSVRGGSGDMSYNLGAGYTRLADYVPSDPLSRQSLPSAYGGMRFARGFITVDLSARYHLSRTGDVFNPLLLSAGFVPESRPSNRRVDFTNETYGSRVTVSPASWWRNQLTIGVDRSTIENVQRRPRLTTPADTFYNIFVNSDRKISAGYNGSVTTTLSTGVVGSLVAGLDHYAAQSDLSFANQVLGTEGAIIPGPTGSLFDSRTTVTNTGYFAQAQVGVRDAVFLTAGLRGEDNSTFGRNLSTPVLPRVGLTGVLQVRKATVKLRGSYGRAMKIPGTGLALGGNNIAPNPLLGPEQQQGWDAGIDLVFGSRGSLSISGYDQTAKNLIAYVQLTSTPPLTAQYQNIGQVSNSGIEVEGTLAFHPIQLRAQYGYSRSRVEDLGTATGLDVQVGDRPRLAPAHTAGAALTLHAREGTALTAGLTYVGSYRDIDYVAFYRCLGGTGLCEPTLGGYTIDFPAVAKVNAAITQQISRQLEGFVSIDNLTNSDAYDSGGNAGPVMGRVTMLGLQMKY